MLRNAFSLVVILILPALPAFAAPTCLCIKCIANPLSYWNLYSPGEAMAPAFAPDQCMVGRKVVDKSELQRGEVIVFERDEKPHFFRLIGLPGDTVQMKDGQVLLNGAALPQTPLPDDRVSMQPYSNGSRPRCANAPVPLGQDCLRQRARETMPSGRSYEVLNIDVHRNDNTRVYTVPQEHVFVLGDNRDNSADSRIPRSAGGIGFVAYSDIWGVIE